MININEGITPLSILKDFAIRHRSYMSDPTVHINYKKLNFTRARIDLEMYPNRHKNRIRLGLKLHAISS